VSAGPLPHFQTLPPLPHPYAAPMPDEAFAFNGHHWARNIEEGGGIAKSNENRCREQVTVPYEGQRPPDFFSIDQSGTSRDHLFCYPPILLILVEEFPFVGVRSTCPYLTGFFDACDRDEMAEQVRFAALSRLIYLQVCTSCECLDPGACASNRGKSRCSAGQATSCCRGILKQTGSWTSYLPTRNAWVRDCPWCVDATTATTQSHTGM